MKYTEIIAALQKSDLENKAEIITALDSHIKAISDEGQTKYEKLAEELEAVLQAAGTNEGDLSGRLNQAVSAIKNLSAELEKKDSKITELENEYSSLERSSTIKEAATKVGLESPSALLEILKPEDKVELKNDAVLVNGKDYKNWVEQDKTAFKASLLPTTINTTLPSGGVNPSNQTTIERTAVQLHHSSHTWGVK